MGTVAFNGKRWDDITDIVVKSEGREYMLMMYQGGRGDTFKGMKFGGGYSSLRIISEGNVKNVVASNAVYVKGNINKCDVGNWCYVEGYIKGDFKCQRGVKVDKTCSVLFGKERDEQERYKGVVNADVSIRRKIIHLDGNFNSITCQYPVIDIIGNIDSLQVQNVMYLKGNVLSLCISGNGITCSMGKAKKIDYKKLNEEKEKRLSRLSSDISNILSVGFIK